MPRSVPLVCCALVLAAGLVGALPARGQDYEDIFLANGLVARLRDPGKFATLRERATKVEQLLIEVLSTQDTMHPQVEVKQESGVWTVYSGPIRVLSVLPKDAAGAGLSQRALAVTWANNLRERLPLATPPSRMGSAAPAPAPGATPPPPVRAPATPPTPTAPREWSPPTAQPGPAPTGAPLTYQAALLVLLDALNSARTMPEDEYLSKRQQLASEALAKVQPFLAGQPPATTVPSALITPPATSTPPATTPPETATPATPPARVITPEPGSRPLPAGLSGLPVKDRVLRKFEIAQPPYLALKTSNPNLYVQVGDLLAEARAAKAAFKWQEADAYLDGALALMGYKVAP